jgi:hypothetical protein
MQKLDNLEAKRQSIDRERIQEEMIEATFRPWITNKAHASTGQYYENGGALKVAERSRAWDENRQKKVEQLKEQLGEPRRDAEGQECTFRPKINSARAGERRMSIGKEV